MRPGPRHLDQDRSGEGPFGELAAGGFRRAAPLPERETIGEIAGLRRGAAQHHVAEAGQAHQRLRLAAIGLAEAAQFGETARDQRGAGALAIAEADGDAGRDGEHVLGRAADLDAARIVRMVDAEGR